jgi:hypothetical protein
MQIPDVLIACAFRASSRSQKARYLLPSAKLFSPARNGGLAVAAKCEVCPKHRGVSLRLYNLHPGPQGILGYRFSGENGDGKKVTDFLAAREEG